MRVSLPPVRREMLDVGNTLRLPSAALTPLCQVRWGWPGPENPLGTFRRTDFFPNTQEKKKTEKQALELPSMEKFKPWSAWIKLEPL